MKRACVIGWPVEHSRSPLIHRYWLNEAGIDGDYDKQAVRAEDFPRFVAALADKNYIGANVTIPHKEQAFALADEVDDAAAAIEAANTLWIDGGRLFATNTDAYGFIAHLDQSAPGWRDRDKPVAILGAGGAARAVLHGLIENGLSEIRLLNRTPARAGSLKSFFDAKDTPSRIEVLDWQKKAKEIADCGLLVNTTSLGMHNNPPLDIDLAGLDQDAVVADIVYAPLETDLLAQAKLRGLQAVDGLGMLLHQAVPGFEKWFDHRPVVTSALRDMIVADLNKIL